jgi:hypothetical protein
MVDDRQHVREAAFRLIDSMGKWSCLPWLIRASTHLDQATAGLAEGLIERWFTPPRCNRVFTKPSHAEREMILEALDKSRRGMEQSFLRRLEFWLKES